MSWHSTSPRRASDPVVLLHWQDGFSSVLHLSRSWPEVRCTRCIRSYQCGLCRDKQLTATAMALFFAALYSLALPMQWTTPRPQSSGAPEDGVSESLEGPANQVYHWLLPLQFALGIASPQEPLWPGFHRAVVLVPLVTVWAASVVYPMDWGKSYQDWPLPTVFACIGSFLICQGVSALGWKYWGRDGEDEQ